MDSLPDELVKHVFDYFAFETMRDETSRQQTVEVLHCSLLTTANVNKSLHAYVGGQHRLRHVLRCLQRLEAIGLVTTRQRRRLSTPKLLDGNAYAVSCLYCGMRISHYAHDNEIGVFDCACGVSMCDECVSTFDDEIPSEEFATCLQCLLKGCKVVTGSTDTA